MAILVLERSSQNRELLRLFIKSYYPHVVMEYAAIDKAQKGLWEIKNRLLYIVAEYELLHTSDGMAFLEQLEKTAEFSWVPLLLISSNDLHMPSSTWTLSNKTRVDAILHKPFNQKNLLKAVDLSFKSRLAQKRTLVYLGNDADEFDSLSRAVNEVRGWKRCVSAETVTEWFTLSENYDWGIGSIVLSESFIKQWGANWLAKYKRSRAGKSVPVMLLNRSPELAKILRPHCKIFIDRPENQMEWLRRVQQLRFEVESIWEYEKTALLLRAKQGEVDSKLIKKISSNLMRNDGINGEAFALLGEYYYRSHALTPAAFFYSRCQEINPTHPESYIRQFEISKSDKIESLLEQAWNYCPDHEQTLQVMQKLYQKKAQELNSGTQTAGAKSKMQAIDEKLVLISNRSAKPSKRSGQA